MKTAPCWPITNGGRGSVTSMRREACCWRRSWAIRSQGWPARRLYEAAGFVPFGPTEPLREGSDLEVQNMVCRL